MLLYMNHLHFILHRMFLPWQRLRKVNALKYINIYIFINMNEHDEAIVCLVRIELIPVKLISFLKFFLSFFTYINLF